MYIPLIDKMGEDWCSLIIALKVDLQQREWRMSLNASLLTRTVIIPSKLFQNHLVGFYVQILVQMLKQRSPWTMPAVTLLGCLLRCNFEVHTTFNTNQETWTGYTDLKGQGWDSKRETNEKDFHLSLPRKENKPRKQNKENWKWLQM